MAKLKYLGKEYKEIEQGALQIGLACGDAFECSDRLATILTQKFPGEFKEMKEFSPGANKMYRKMTSFKSK